MSKEVRKQINKVWRLMPREFAGVHFLKLVKTELGRMQIYGDTILRELRDMRTDGLINYEVPYKRDSIYRKIKIVK